MFEAYSSGNHRLLSYTWTRRYVLLSNMKVTFSFATRNLSLSNSILLWQSQYKTRSISVLSFLYHFHDHVKNIVKHILLDIHDIQIITNNISLHQTVLTMQHPFQFYLLRSHLCCFCIDDNLARTFGGNKKRFTTIQSGKLGVTLDM